MSLGCSLGAASIIIQEQGEVSLSGVVIKMLKLSRCAQSHFARSSIANPFPVSGAFSHSTSPDGRSFEGEYFVGWLRRTSAR